MTATNFEGEDAISLLAKQLQSLKTRDDIEINRRATMYRNCFVGIEKVVTAGGNMHNKFEPGNSLFLAICEAYHHLPMKHKVKKITTKQFLKVLKVIVLAGYTPRKEDLAALKHKSIATDATALHSWITDISVNGFSLKQSCRIKIRSVLVEPLYCSIKSPALRLTSHYKDYLHMEAL